MSARKTFRINDGNAPKAAPDTIISSTGPSGSMTDFNGARVVLDDVRPQRPRNDPLDADAEGGADMVSVVDLKESADAREDVDGLREGIGVVAGVIYESIPVGKTVLYNLE